MKIHINLSSDPFRRDRPWIVGSFVIGSILVFTLGIFTYMAITGRDEAKEARTDVEKARAQMNAVTNEQHKLELNLTGANNADLIYRSVFLNQLLLRKGISWTRIFSDLEKVTPGNVRLISVRPQITSTNEVYLEMVVGSQSPEPVIEMLVRLESSPQFGAVHQANTLPPSQTEPLYRSRIQVNYVQKL